MRLPLAASVLAGLAAPTPLPAQASLLGTGFTATYRYPALGTVYSQSAWSPPSFTVGAGQETVGNVENVTGIAVDFGISSLSLVLTTSLVNPAWVVAPFNGPVFTAALPHGLTVATVDAGATTMAGFDDPRVSLTAAEIRLNWAGLGYQTGTRVEILFFAVPEPGSLALLAGALAALMLATAGWRRRPAARRGA